MNISATQNVKLAIQAVGEHRFRSLLTVLGIVIGITTVVTVASLLTGLRAGVVTFFQELGPDNIFVYKTSGDPSQEPPKERKRRPMQPEYAEVIRRWSSSVADVGLQLYIPPVVDGKPITARVPGFETENINVAGQSPNMGDICAARFRGGPIFHRGGGSARRARRDHRLQRGGFAVSGRHGAGQHHDDGRRGVQHHRRVCQGEGRILRRKRPGQHDHHSAAHRRKPLPAGGPLHDHGQGEDRETRGGFRGGAGHHAPHTPPGNRREGRFLDLDARPDHPAVRPHHEPDRPGGHRHFRARPAGGRHRRDEHHAGERHRADAGDRRAEGLWARAAATSSGSSWWRR